MRSSPSTDGTAIISISDLTPPRRFGCSAALPLPNGLAALPFKLLVTAASSHALACDSVKLTPLDAIFGA